MSKVINKKTLQVLLVIGLIYVLFVSAIPAPVQAQDQEGLFKITLIAPGTANQARRQWAQIVRSTLQQVGIDARVVYLGWGAVFDRVLFAPQDIWGKTYDEGGFDALFVGYGWTIPFPIPNLITVYGNGTGKAAEKYFPPGPNWYYFEDEYYSKLATEYIRTLDQNKRIEIIKELQKYLQKHGPDFIIYYDRTVAVVNPKLQNFDPLIYYAPSWWKGVDSVTIAVPGEPTAFNYILSNSWYDIPFLYAINDISNGIGITMNYKKEFVPSTFESWESSPDGKEWTINVRKGIHWQDGVELTADDFIYYLEVQYTPETGSQGLGYWTTVLGSKVTFKYTDGTTVEKDFTVEGETPTVGLAEALDKYTIHVVLPETYGIFYPEAFWPPAPKHVLENIPPEQWSTHSFNTGQGTYNITKPDGTVVTWTGPMGIGPYKFVSYDPVKMVVTLEKNPDYWNKTGLESIGLFTIETVKVQFIAEKEAALAALKNREVDILDYNYHFEKDINRIDPSWGATQVFDAYGLQELGLNMKHPVWGTGVDTPLGRKDPSKAAEAAYHVRRAIDSLIPRRLIIDSLMDGFPRPGIAFVLPPQVGFDETLTPTPYDIDEAKRHLAAAGYEVAGYQPVQINVPQLPSFQPGAGEPVIPGFVVGMPVVLTGRFVNASSGQAFALPLHLEVQMSKDGGKTWEKIGETSTDTFGNFQYVVVPTKSGSYMYRVYFPGNAIPLEEWVNIVGAQYGEVYPVELLRIIPPLYSPTVEVEVGSLGETLAQYLSKAKGVTKDDLNKLSASVQDALNSISAQLSSQINSLKQEDAKLKADIEALQGQLGNATNIAYAAIVIAIVLGAAAIVLARRRE